MFSVQQNIFDTGASNDCKMSFYTFKLCFIMFTVSSGKTAMFSFITALSRVRDTCHVSSSLLHSGDNTKLTSLQIKVVIRNVLILLILCFVQMSNGIKISAFRV